MSALYRSWVGHLLRHVFAGILLSASIFLPASAADLREQAVQRMLAGRQYAELQKGYDAALGSFEHGYTGEFELADLFISLYSRDDVYSEPLNGWVEAFPNSSTAYLARGIYRAKMGEFRFVNQRSRAKDAAFIKTTFAAAKDDLRTALRLNPQSFLAVVTLIRIAQHERDPEARHQYLEMANAMRPGNTIARMQVLIGLGPRWGGTFEAMKQFLDENQAKGLAGKQMAMLNAVFFEEYGVEAEKHGDFEVADGAYVKAMMLAKDANSLFRNRYLWHSRSICRQPAHETHEYCEDIPIIPQLET